MNSRRAAWTAVVSGAVLLLARGAALSQRIDNDLPASQPASRHVSDAASRPVEDTAWGRGVSAQQRAKATALYRQGNQLFADEKYSEAMKRYSSALEHWDHPAIHYNMVECLINLGRNLEAHAHLEQAMRYGPAPLGEQLFRQARTYRNLLERSLSRIRIVCRQPHTEVVLDGKALFVGPGEATRLVSPGVHAVVATGAGFVPEARQVTLAPGKLTEVALSLAPQRAKLVLRRRWHRTWVPWTVLGAGIVIAAASLPLYLAARRDFDDQKASFDTLCSAKPEGGCIPSTLNQDDLRKWNDLRDLESRARTEYVSSITLLGVGAAAAATGLTLIILNLPRVVEKPATLPKLSATVVPLVTRSGAAVSVRLAY